MNTALTDAVYEFNIMKENPIQRIKIQKNVEKSTKVHYFTKDQLNTFLNAVKTPVKKTKYQRSIQYYVLFTLMARTGIRIGEALALTWDDFDEINKKLTVNKTLVYPTNSSPYISSPKSRKSDRIIKLDNPTIKMLKQQKTNRAQVVLQYKNYKQPKENIIFYQHDGRWLRTNVVREYIKEVCKRTNLPVLSPHVLRHTHAVHLLEAGVEIKLRVRKTRTRKYKGNSGYLFAYYEKKSKMTRYPVTKNMSRIRNRAKNGQASSPML
ncbi:site-specific integrase [Shouchella shacheensis]|uniref:site-specific integrase n=1 Tax=Shouchella shacheensis TaxID=1649580 RepID=UPI000A8F0C67|nr:site-specific integrase [Shouchella shacheensis]